MNQRKKLFSVKNPYDHTGQALFLEACRENYAHQRNHCEDYKKLCDGLKSPSPEDLKDPAELPVIPTMLMKQHDFNAGGAIYTATSSGTSGRRSHVHFDLGALLCAGKMGLKISRYHGILSMKPTRYILMAYKPHRSNKAAAVRTAYLSTFLAPALSRKFVLKHNGTDYQPDFDTVITSLTKYEKHKAPVRIIGFPAYTFFLFKILEERGLSFRLPPGSKIMIGGGWKQFYQEEADKKTFYLLAEKTLGIKENDIVEFFSAVEHPILYSDCTCHHFHVPVYSHVVIRDPDTLEPLPLGQTGLINLITPLCRSTPILSVMTDDLGILHDGTNCPCGVKSPYLEIVGRVAPEDIKTCAAGASEILSATKV